MAFFSLEKQKNPIKLFKFLKLFLSEQKKVCTSISCLINLKSVLSGRRRSLKEIAESIQCDFDNDSN